MALSVYFREDIANVVRALGQNRGGDDFANGYCAALADVAMAFGCKPEPSVSVSVVHVDSPSQELVFGWLSDRRAGHDTAGNGG